MKYVYVNNPDIDELKSVIENWLSSYKEALSIDSEILIKRNDENDLLLELVNFDEILLFFLVDYLKYPIGLNVSIDSVGYSFGRNSDSEISESNIMVVPNVNYEKYNGVKIATESGDNYLFTFNKKIIEIESSTVYSFIETSNFHLIQVVNQPRYTSNNQKNGNTTISSEELVYKRFKIISLCWIVLISIWALSISTFQIINPVPEQFIVAGIVLGLWFLIDYKVLQRKKTYLLSVLLALLNLFVGVNVIYYLYGQEESTLLFTFIGPISLLGIQLPTRIIFKFLFRREPEIERGSNFLNLLYTMVIAFSLILIPVAILAYDLIGPLFNFLLPNI